MILDDPIKLATNFMTIICDQLILEDDIPMAVRKTFYGGTTMASAVSISS
jgi:hypothetical protein